MRIAITGATGFVGRHLCTALSVRDYSINQGVRLVTHTCSEPHSSERFFALGDINGQTDFSTMLEGVDCVVHCAARVHDMRQSVSNASAAYRTVNVDATRALAQQSAALGVKRLVFLSSAKVYGEWTEEGRRVSHTSPAQPQDAYARSKWEAEQQLAAISAETGLEVVVVRPPLVYGPGVQGNMLAVMRWLRRGMVLPLGAVHNTRSFVGVGNLVDLLIQCIERPQAAGQVLLVTDGEDLSTTALLQRMAAALGCSARLVAVPPSVLDWMFRVIGKPALSHRLLAHFAIDSSYTQELLDWHPPFDVDYELRQTAQWFLEHL